MRQAVSVLLLPTLLFAGVEVTDGNLRQEGAYWISVERRTIPVANGRFHIGSTGPVRVRGASRSDTSATLQVTRRVRAATAADAKRLLNRLAVSYRAGGVKLTCPGRCPVTAQLEVYVPRSTREVRVGTATGDIDVMAISGNVRVETGAGTVDLDGIGGNVFARTGGGAVRLGRIAGTANCASGGGIIEATRVGGDAALDTAGGDIRVGESGGALHASTSGGNIRVQRALAHVTARTAGGKIDVVEARGIVVAGNAGGSIHVGSAGGARLEATGGGIRMKGPSGPLRAVTDVGSILAELIRGVRIQDSLLSTGAGDITVYIPSDMAVTIEALNESRRQGRIVSEFREIPVRYSREDEQPSARAEGALNGGGPLLKLTSSSGTIYLKRTD